MNLVPVFLGSAPGRALVDSGAVRSLMSGEMYRRIQKRGTKVKHVTNERMPNLYSADSSPLVAQAIIDIDVKVGGVKFPFVFIVMEKLGFDCILGMDLLEATEAVIDIRTNALHLFGGLTSVAMTHTGQHVTVATVIRVTIPPFSEGVFAVEPTRSVGRGNYMIEGENKAPYAALMVARTLVNTSRNSLHCRVLNPTDKPMILKPKTTVGVLSPVTIHKGSINRQVRAQVAEVSVEEMRKAVMDKKIPLEDTVLTGNDLDNLIRLLYENLDLFASELADMPGSDVMLHRIDTGDSPPIRRRSYRHSPADRAEISRQVEEMERAGIVEPSDSPWCSPVILVTKCSDGSKRFVVDYRSLNAKTVLSAYPLPLFEEIVDTISVQKPVLWSSLDLKSGFWQLGLDPETKDRTGFQTDKGQYVFNRLSMGLSGAVNFFQNVMQRVLRGLVPSVSIVYLDDVLVLASSPDQMMERLKMVFDRFRESNLRMHPQKCHLGMEKIKFLGHYFDRNGISVDPEKIKIVKEFPTPRTVKQVRSFLGLANYYRRFIDKYSQITFPLRGLLRADVKFVWTPECQEAFEKLKTALTTAPVLVLPQFNKPFILTTDASITGIAYILSQKDDGGREHVVSYGGRGLRPPETRWTISEMKCFDN